MKNVDDHINEIGLSRFIESIFPKLESINFDEIEFDSKLNSSNPIKYLTNDVNGKWYFGLGSMAMIFKSFENKQKNKILNNLLLENQIDKDSGYSIDAQNITFWNGNGFKIELTKVNDIDIIIITNANITSTDNLEFKPTDLAIDITNKADWISGFDKVYAWKSINKANKDPSKFINVPLLFEEENEDPYILIRVQTFEIGKSLIDSLIDKNGKKKSFKLISGKKEWKHLYQGYCFTIGYLTDYNSIRINSLPPKQVSIEDDKLKRGIHPLSDKINELVIGLNTPVLNPAEGGVPDGRFYATNEKASIIVSFNTDVKKAIKKYNDIVIQHNPEDKILKLKDSSLEEWLNDNPEEYVELDVENKFKLQLSKGNSLYRINLYPAAGLSGSWDFKSKNSDELNQAKSTASQQINISEDKFEIKEVKKTIINESNEKEIKKRAFVKDKVIVKKKERKFNLKEKLKLKEKLNFKNKNYDFKWLKRVLRILFVLLLIYFLFKACSDPCKGNAICYYDKGVQSEEVIEYDEAFKYYKKAIKTDRKYVEAYIAKGNLHFKLEEYEKAIKEYTKVISIDGENWLAYTLRGNANEKLGKNKYSSKFKKAMKDFDQSIEINDSNENAFTFYNRGLLKEKLEIEACDDFVYSCDREFDLGCERYNSICYPKNGEYTLTNEFGRGVFNNDSNGKIILDNSNGKKDLVVVIRRYIPGEIKGARVRAQFIRKGGIITMYNFPNGTFYTEDYYGEYWIKNLDPKNRFLRNILAKNYKSDPFNLRGGSMTYTYGGANGDMDGTEISEDDFFN